jgi:transcription antitermination factor NusG
MNIRENQSALRWYALYTRSRHEKRVSQALSERAIESFLPLQKCLRQWSDRRRWVEVPLIPSYVFARATSRHREQILQTPGVVRFVSFDGCPAVVRPEEIEFLRRAVAPEARADVVVDPFSQQAEVRIVNGSFAGYKGRLVGKRGSNRVAVKIEELEYSIVVTVSRSQLVM